MSDEMNGDEMFEDVADEKGSKIDVEISGSAEVSQDLRDQVKDADGRALRAQAELENYRRRMRREMDDQAKFANQGLLRDLLPVIDNINRAVSAASQDDKTDGMLEGVLMVAQQLLDTLEKHHCSRVEAIGSPFDPNLHEALSQMPSEEHVAGNVVQVVQEGYVLHDRILRPAHVIVSTGPALAGDGGN